MRLASELINKPVITVKEGQEIGKVQDFYLDQRLTQLVAIYLDSGGFLSSEENVISWSDVVTVGQDAILVKDAAGVTDVAGAEGIITYIRRAEIGGRQITTPGGTKIGRVGDVVLDDDAHIIGLSLTNIQVSGPIAASKAINRTAIVDFGHENGVMTADLAEAEKADLQVAYDGLFGEPSVSLSES
jgi:sporulation protein YlmC with PRC-barrel domain